DVRQVRAVVVVASIGLLGDAKTAADGCLSVSKKVVGKPEPGRHLDSALGDEAARIAGVAGINDSAERVAHAGNKSADERGGNEFTAQRILTHPRSSCV